MIQCIVFYDYTLSEMVLYLMQTNLSVFGMDLNLLKQRKALLEAHTLQVGPRMWKEVGGFIK